MSRSQTKALVLVFAAALFSTGSADAALAAGKFGIGAPKLHHKTVIQAREIQMAMLYALIFPATILSMTALSVVLRAGLAGLGNAGPHGLSEILYAFSSTTGNNGSAFAGLSGASPY